MIYPGIIGTGFYVPKNKMDNARLSKINKVPTKEIYEKTGIKERRIADKNESASDMGFKASIKAIKSSGRGKLPTWVTNILSALRFILSPSTVSSQYFYGL